MQNKNLIPLSDFVLEQNEKRKKDELSVFHFAHRVIKYTEFLKQSLKLEYFVPCDEKGNVVEYKKMTVDGCPIWDGGPEWQKAKEKVLFEGFEQKGGLSVAKAICQTYQLIEDLTYKKIPLVNLTLTPSALNKIGIKE